MSAVDEVQLQSAKAYLMQSGGGEGTNLYDHLSEVLAKVLEERPANAIDIFESISTDLKLTRIEGDNGPSSAQNVREKAAGVELANIEKALFVVDNGDDNADGGGSANEGHVADILEWCHHFEAGDVGLGRNMMFRLQIALKKLVESEPLKTVRLWGKIQGTEGSYFIAEGEFRDREGEEVPLEEEKEKAEEDETTENKEEDSEAPPPLPKSTYQPPPIIPREQKGIGANKNTYWVCTYPGSPWIKLPPVTPAQIVCSRSIRKLLTGRLDATISSYPPFPGNEANYLRAQIARISSSTQVSPLRYFIFDEEDEDEVDPEGRDSFITNPEFEGLTVEELSANTFANWVHHAQYLLPQGRTTWFNTKRALDEEEEDEERSESGDEPEPETGPSLLSPLSEDAEEDGQPAWSVSVSSKLIPQYASVHLRSNLWPGAHAFAVGRNFGNIYVGYGLRHSSNPYSPPQPPPVEQEYNSELCVETEDPSAQEEKELLEADKDAEDAAGEEDGEGGGEEEEDEDE